MVEWRKDAFQTNQFSFYTFYFLHLIWVNVDSGIVGRSPVKTWILMLNCSPGRGVFPCQGFHPHPLTPFSHHLPRWLRRTSHIPSPIATNAFFIDHYPAFPSPLLATAQSETPASPRSLHVWPMLTGGEETSIRRVRLFTLIWRVGVLPAGWMVGAKRRSGFDVDVLLNVCP